MEEKKNNGSEQSYEDLIKKYSSEYTEEKTEGNAHEEEIFHDRQSKVSSFSLDFDAEKELNDEVGEQRKGGTNKGVYFAAYSGEKNRHSLQKEAASSKKAKGGFAETVGRYYQYIKKNTLAYTLSFVGIILLASALLSTYAMSCANDIFAIRQGEQNILVTIPQDATTGQVIDILHDEGLVKHTNFCKVFAKIMGYKDEYLAGVYYLSSDMGLEGMLRRTKLLDAGAETVDVNIPEGFSITQIAQRLEENDVCKGDMFIKTLEETAYNNYPFLETAIGSTNRFRRLEGFIYPATYNFYVNEAPASVAKKFLDAFNDNIMTAKNIARAKELGKTMDEIVIIASIIQREAANTEQMYLVSSVLHNRLNNSSTYPRLECDAFDSYYMNEILHNTDTERANELFSGYSRYITEGLPNGPICNPGAKAVDAALNPEKTDYFFFRHDKNGEIYMAVTLAQHEENGRKIRQSAQS